MLHAQGVALPFYQSSDDSSEANRIELTIARLTELGVQVRVDAEGYLLYVPPIDAAQLSAWPLGRPVPYTLTSSCAVITMYLHVLTRLV
jgi:hypothetical protein